MKFFRNTLLIIALLPTGSVFSKTTASRGGKAVTPQPAGIKQAATNPPANRPAAPQKAYAQILTKINTAEPTVEDRSLLMDIKAEVDRQMNMLKSGARKSTAQPQPIPAKKKQQQKQIATKISAKAHCTTNSVIMILDPKKAETLERAMTYGSEAMVGNALLALQEKAAPIIMTSNILEIITTIRQQIGDKDLQRLRKLIETTADWQLPHKLEDQLNKAHNMHERKNMLSLLSLISFDNKNFNFYFHESANLVLIIPKQYIQANQPEAINLDTYEQAQACGFGPNYTSTIDDLSVDNLLTKLHSQQSTSTFISGLISLFTPQKQNGELISPEEDIKWTIYMTGHGGPNPILIANLSSDEFSQLMTFFSTDIDTAYLHYSTCFAGGYNQIFVNDTLSALNVNFIVSSQGVGETVTYGLTPMLIPNNSKTRLIPNEQPYTNFFRLLRLFICQPEEFVKIKGRKKEPIEPILRAIVPYMEKTNQPFVRFPGAGVFGGLTLSKNTENKTPSITQNLTETMVKAHEIENKPIKINNNTNTLIVNPSRINIPLNLGKNAQCAIISPTSAIVMPPYEVIHVFKEINFENTIQLLLYNFIHFNAHLGTRTFIVKTLTGISYKQSGLPILPGKTNIIHNLIIQIKTMLAWITMSANVNVSFELNGNIYECTINIENFDDPKLLDNIKKITFTSQSAATIDMDSVANEFLSPEEITELAKPITLDTIAQFVDSKIDQLEPSIFQQPDTNNKALLEFAKQRAKK